MASTMPVPDTLEKLDMYIDGEFVEPASGEYYAGLADKIEGSVVHADKPAFTFTRHEPLGVCVGIIPWNSPLERVDIDRGGDGESLRHRLSGGIGTAPPRTPP